PATSMMNASDMDLLPTSGAGFSCSWGCCSTRVSQRQQRMSRGAAKAAGRQEMSEDPKFREAKGHVMKSMVVILLLGAHEMPSWRFSVGDAAQAAPSNPAC